jgi:pilus assembly protein Flp/PilA
MSVPHASEAGCDPASDPDGGTPAEARGGLSLRALDVRERLRSVVERQRGQGMVEYGLILILIAIVVILILQVVGRQVNNVFSNLSSGLGT